ncbi:hypothetical protein FB451DRAFT_1200074 [Mycena latifolia]|nr:hypothetical protein FB451DRAFT_1200074 [Mycena latifolia]
MVKRTLVSVCSLPSAASRWCSRAREGRSSCTEAVRHGTGGDEIAERWTTVSSACRRRRAPGKLRRIDQQRPEQDGEGGTDSEVLAQSLVERINPSRETEWRGTPHEMKEGGSSRWWGKGRKVVKLPSAHTSRF